MTDTADLRAFAETLADAARETCMPYFRRGMEIDTKSDDSPVTRADRETEARLRALIRERHPEAGIFGEEEGAHDVDAEYVWVLDPIDGTKSFITGYPLFGTLIALTHRGRPVVGVIDMPALDERWVGSAGAGTTYRWGGRAEPVHTRGAETIAEAWLSLTSIDMFDAADWPAVDALSRRARMRRFGGDCYQYGRLASGGLDLVIEASLKPYDHMALVPVIEGAGGRVTDWTGAALSFESDGRVVAAGTPALHRAALDALAKV